MAEQRIFGREVTLKITLDGELLSEITAIRSCSFETRHKIVTEGYLGEGAMRQDEILDEVGGSISINPEGPGIFDLQRVVYERSSARSAAPPQINLMFRAQFPGGVRVKITVPDIKLDPIPLNVGGRDAYPEITLNYKSDKYILSS